MTFRVTVGILSWNRKDALKTALLSVQRQTIFDDAEVLIVDNCSTDGTREMLREEFSWVRLIERETNSGLAEGRNILVREARAPVVFWMDDDCELVEDDCLERLVAEMEAHPDYAVVFARILEGDGGRPHTYLPADLPLEPFEMQASFPDSFASGGTCVWKQQFLELGGYDSDFFRMGVERAFACKVFAAGKLIRYYPEVTIIHRPHKYGRNFRVITYYSTRNKLLGLWRYVPLHVALSCTLFEIVARFVRCLSSASRMAGFAQALLAFAWKLPRCLLRERNPMGPEAFSRWGHTRHYLIRSFDEYRAIPPRLPYWRFVFMEVKLALLRRLGRPRPRPFLPGVKSQKLPQGEVSSEA